MKKLLPVLLLASSAAMAQETATETPVDTSGTWGFSGTLSTVAIDSDAALQQGVDDSALQLGLFADYYRSQWKSTFGIELLQYDDNQEFSQSVVGTGLFNDGDRSRESSDATAVVLSAATGYQWRFGAEQNSAVSLQGGFGAVLASDRSIANCSNCRSEDIEIDGGVFIKAAWDYSFESVSFGLYAQQYVSGDLGSVFGVTLGTAF